MCGLVGVAGNIIPADEKVFKDMLVMDSLRGHHSVGVARVSNADQLEVFKKAVSPVDFFTMQGFKSVMGTANKVLIGHNRYATQGAINGVNAHPFDFENVVGAHNGTLRNQRLLPDHQDYEVDSENIYHSINIQGMAKTAPLLNGAFALSYWDKKNSTLNFYRNKERPLHVCSSVDGRTMYWASEPWMLEGALWRNKVTHGEIRELDVHSLLTVRIPDNIRTVAAMDRLKFSLKPLTPFVAPPVVTRTFNNVAKKKSPKEVVPIKKPSLGSRIRFRLFGKQNKSVALSGFSLEDGQSKLFVFKAPLWVMHNVNSKQNKEYTGIVTHTTTVDGISGHALDPLSLREIKVVPKKVAPKTIEFNGQSLTELEFMAKTDNGTCSWCAGDMAFEEGHMVFNAGGTAGGLCMDCAKDPLTREYLFLDENQTLN